MKETRAGKIAQKIASVVCSERPAGKWLKSFLLAFLGLIVLYVLLFCWLDPYVCFHKAWLVRQTYSDPVATIPGMLRHFSYDTVLIGSSMCKNFRIGEIDRTLGVSAVKATSAGQTGDDVGRIIQLLTTEKRGSVKRIITGYDLWAYSKGDRCGLWRSRKYLWDGRISWEYFFSADSLQAALNVAVTNLAPSGTKGADLEKDFDRMFCDKTWRFVYSQKSMEEAIRRDPSLPVPVRHDTMELTERLLLNPVAACPEIRMDLFLPPYSVYFWSMLLDCSMLEGYLQAREALAQKIQRHPNIILHDFQAETKIICHLDHYKDCNHYSAEVNRFILKHIADGRYAADPVKVRAANETIRQEAQRYLPRYRELAGKRKGGK